jgi:hypothetical protein
MVIFGRYHFIQFLKKDLTLKLLLFIVSLLFLSSSFSAEISAKKRHLAKVIVIEGQIEEGDYEKFVNAVLQGGTKADIFIASIGGNAIEAMKIGRLIRALKFSTIAPLLNDKGLPYCEWAAPITNSENCTCQSACVLIYLSGINRSGSYLGVHRTFIKHDVLKNLPIDKATQYSKEVSKYVREYLSEMGSPPSLSEKIESISSDSIDLLDEAYINEYLSGYSKDIEEWLIAHCGGSEDELFLSNFGRKNNNDWIKDYVSISGCKKRIIRKEKGRAFYSTIIKILPALRMKYIPRRSLLDSVIKIKNIDNLELPDLLGKNAFEVLDLLSLVGLGQNFSTKEINDAFGKELRVDDTLHMSIDQEGKVKSFYLFFHEQEGDDKYLYKQHFLNKINSNSTLKDFENLYGKYKFKENDIDILKFGADKVTHMVYVFNYNNYEITVRFSIQDNKFSNLGINQIGAYVNKRKLIGDLLKRLRKEKK